jgi:hypothetical protein
MVHAIIQSRLVQVTCFSLSSTDDVCHMMIMLVCCATNFLLGLRTNNYRAGLRRQLGDGPSQKITLNIHRVQSTCSARHSHRQRVQPMCNPRSCGQGGGKLLKHASQSRRWLSLMLLRLVKYRLWWTSMTNELAPVMTPGKTPIRRASAAHWRVASARQHRRTMRQLLITAANLVKNLSTSSQRFQGARVE